MLVRWKNPVDEFFGLNDELTRPLQRAMAPSRSLMPAVDVSEDEHNFTIMADLPGLKKDEVKVEFTDGVLVLKGEKQSSVETKDEKWHRKERSFGAFERRFEVNVPIDAGSISAKFNDGVLTIVLPKAEEAKPREISIEN